MSQGNEFKSWAIVELMGHRRLAGMVMEVEMFGATMLRVDVPTEDGAEEPFATQFYSPSAVYCLTPTSEETARAVAATSRPAPVHRWELPAPDDPGGGEFDDDHALTEVS